MSHSPLTICLWHQRFEKAAAAHKNSEDALKASQRKLCDRDAQLANVNQEAKKLEAVIQDLRKECQELKDALESAKYALEQETLSRVDLENKLQSKEEELNFKKEMYSKVKVWLLFDFWAKIIIAFRIQINISAQGILAVTFRSKNFLDFCLKENSPVL